MIFYITHKFLSDIDASEDKISLIDNIDLVIRAHRERRHYLEMENRNVIDKLLSLDLSPVSKQVLQTRKHLTGYNKEYFNRVCTYIELIVGDSNMKIRKEVQENATVIFLPIQRIDISVMDATQILCEDISDVDIYNFIAKRYCDKMQIKSINLTKEAEPGSGKNIPKIYKMYVEHKKKLCFCISDTDCRYPDYISNTVEQLKQIENSHENYLCYYYQLPVHELENLVPKSILQKIPNSAEMLSFIEKLDINQVKCLDYKKGYTWKLFRDNEQRVWRDDDVAQYWASLFLDLEMISETELYEAEDKKPKSEKAIVKGMGNNMMKKALTHMQADGHFHIESYLDEIWTDLGKNIYSWCIAPEFRAI